MHQDFLTAIFHNEPLDAVYDRLLKEERNLYERRRAKLHYEFNTADKVLRALHEHIDSDPFKWAQAYMREAEAAEKKKGDEQLRHEEERRQIEAEYLEEMREEIAYMKKQHSER